jgi:hypothetical protein
MEQNRYNDYNDYNQQNFYKFVYSKNIHGIRWGKYLNGELHVLFEVIGKFETLKIKNLIDQHIDKIYYFVYKERVTLYNNGLTKTEYIWLECEKEFMNELLCT